MPANIRQSCYMLSRLYYIDDNPFMPTGAFNICCPRDCVSRHNGGNLPLEIYTRLDKTNPRRGSRPSAQLEPPTRPTSKPNFKGILKSHGTKLPCHHDVERHQATPDRNNYYKSSIKFNTNVCYNKSFEIFNLKKDSIFEPFK